MMGSVSSFGLSIHTGSNIIDCVVCDSGNTLFSGFEGALWKILSDTMFDICDFYLIYLVFLKYYQHMIVVTSQEVKMNSSVPETDGSRSRVD